MDMFRRKHPRVQAINLVSTFEVSEDKIQEFGHLGATLNISEGGVLFESKVPFPLLSILKLEIALGERVIIAQGRVVRMEEVEPHRIQVAVHFTEINDDDREFIRLFVEQREKSSENDLDG
ncbi:MAG: PilZ domain-containing protein [Planctomycetota bacterium]|nr:MAG: PilZ domain-containing protein [Planctomycetota bacterium]